MIPFPVLPSGNKNCIIDKYIKLFTRYIVSKKNKNIHYFINVKYIKKFSIKSIYLNKIELK